MRHRFALARLGLCCICWTASWAALGALPAWSADTCAGATLGSTDSLPIFESSSTSVLGNDFTPTGPGCASRGGDDRVVCFRPTSACTVTVTCESGSSNVAANQYSGLACPAIAAASSCVASNDPGGVGAVLTDRPLAAGVLACFVCDTESTSGDLLTLGVVATLGSNCGPLPAQLLSFTID